MNIRYTTCCLALVSAVAICAPTTAHADQETLNRAKGYYASASYDEALQLLGQLREKSDHSSATEMTEVAAYQMLCLVALVPVVVLGGYVVVSLRSTPPDPAA